MKDLVEYLEHTYNVIAHEKEDVIHKMDYFNEICHRYKMNCEDKLSDDGFEISYRFSMTIADLIRIVDDLSEFMGYINALILKLNSIDSEDSSE